MSKTEEQKIFDCEWFCPADPTLKEKKMKAHKLGQRFSELREDDPEREDILREMLGSIGEGSFICRPAFFHYGVHTRIGKGTFINYNLVVQDDNRVEIGDRCDFGPNVTIVTPTHPLRADERQAMKAEDGTCKKLCLAKPVKIGNECWICANVTILPGVTIGDRCVIAAGSVVTHDIPDDSLAMGVPCRVVRKITEEDRIQKEN